MSGGPVSLIMQDGTPGMLLAVTHVQTLLGAQPLTSASGFFFRRNGRLFLITSRHVLFDAPSRHTPDHVMLSCHVHPRDLTQVKHLRVPLYADGRAAWHQARDSGGDIDVAALEISPSHIPQPHAMQSFGVEDIANGHPLCDVGDSLAIPGYPMGFHDALHHLPVVRSASIASAYGVRFQGQGYFLTDSRTHRGSSGAPVLLHEADRGSGRRWRLLGVHASRMDMGGRDAAQDESLGLNCAWYADILTTLTRVSVPSTTRAPLTPATVALRQA
jgi:hypothetical protein